MPSRRQLVALLCVTAVALPASARSQTPVTDSTTRPAPAWRDSVRFASGPSVGAPPSDFTGEKPPADWCLHATGRSTGDFGMMGQGWDDASRAVLRRFLEDTNDVEAGWRRIIGGAPQITPADSIVAMSDSSVCRDIAAVINRDLLGWTVGPPPVVVYLVKGFLFAFPSNASMGEFGLAVGMDERHRIRGVTTW